ncbi:MAG: YlbF family regulator [Anaerolineae bacterium]|nr:YlbF family regulator [Anaerolineae bacterium]
MELSEEIKQSARALGQSLSADETVRQYLELRDLTQRDEETINLETEHAALYQKLSERQRSGMVLDREELDRYFELKRKVQNHRSIVARDMQLENAKVLLGQAAQRITSILGVDYSNFAG